VWCRKTEFIEDLIMIAVAFLSLITVGSIPERAHAGGFFLYEVGTPDVGMASAGYASGARVSTK